MLGMITIFWAVPTAFSQETNTLSDKLSQLSQPWHQKIHRVSREEYEATMNYWASQFSQLTELERVGITLEGFPILLLKITDKAVPDNNKQVCLITALHCGPERSGTTTILHLIEWLLGNSPEAQETRRKQIVLLMPVVNPYAFFVTDRFGNSQGIDPYTGGGAQNWDLTAMSYKQLDKSPEIAAVLSVIDQYRPEVHADVHGVGLQEFPENLLGDRTMRRGQSMFEVTGSAYSNYTLRPWDWRVTEKMLIAGVDAGFPSERFEADAQRLFWGPALQSVANELWRGRPNFYTAQYGYHRYHTMLSAFEVAWEQGGVARLQALLQIGNSPWIGEQEPGYPVNRVASFLGRFVTASGKTAEQTRASRVDLWRRQSEFSHGLLYPQFEGREAYLLSLTSAGDKMLVEDKDEFLENISASKGIDVDPIREIISSGPEIKLYVERGQISKEPDHRPIQYEMGLRLRIPFSAPELVDVRLNGRLLEPGEEDGYQTWFGDGFTQVHIRVPVEVAAKADLLIVTCLYNAKTRRDYGWTPPQAVLDKITHE